MSIIEEKYSDILNVNVYHYTTAEGLLGILLSGKLWATNVNFLNDSKEIREGINILAHEIEERINGCDKSVKGLLQDTKRLLVAPKMYLNAPVFVTSLSEEGDLLSQWRGYCDNGEGFSIGFDRASLNAILSNPQISIAKCIYDREEQVRMISALLDEAIEEHADEYEPSEDINKIFQLLWRSFLDQFFRMAALIKHRSFKEEKEWRIVYYMKEPKHISHLEDPGYSNNLKILHRARGRYVIPYVSLPLKDSSSGYISLPEIIAGPSADPDLVYTGLLSLKKSHTACFDEGDIFDDSGLSKIDVKSVRNSKIPLRTL